MPFCHTQTELVSCFCCSPTQADGWICDSGQHQNKAETSVSASNGGLSCSLLSLVCALLWHSDFPAERTGELEMTNMIPLDRTWELWAEEQHKLPQEPGGDLVLGLEVI